MLVPPNHPNLDYFSFETNGFGDSPFHETPISVWYLESTSKCFTSAGTFLIHHQSSWHPRLKPWPFMADSAAEKDWKRTCSHATSLQLAMHRWQGLHGSGRSRKSSFGSSAVLRRRMHLFYRPCILGERFDDHVGDKRWSMVTPTIYPMMCQHFCSLIPPFHPMIPSLLESKSLNDTTTPWRKCFAPGTGSSCHIGSED